MIGSCRKFQPMGCFDLEAGAKNSTVSEQYIYFLIINFWEQW